MQLNGIIGAEIPYYKMMNKAMPGPAKDTKRKPKNSRLTEIDPKTNKPRLKSGVPISRAVEVLYMFENTDVLPYQIEEMKVTISNLQTRVKKLEDWQEWKRTKNRKDTCRNTPRENRRRKTERRVSVETINTR